MAYIRHKVIKGHVYYYLVEGHRDGKRVRQKVLKYLGKHGALSGSSGIVYHGFKTPSDPESRKSVEARQRRALHKTFEALGYEVSYDISDDVGIRGFINVEHCDFGGDVISREVAFTRRPTVNTMCHELGHAIDFHLREQECSFWEAEAFLKAQSSMQNEFEKAGTEKYQKMLDEDPTLIDGAFFQNYVFTEEEGFANSFELFMADYKKAMRVVPNMVAVFHDMIRGDEEIRRLIEALDVWQIEDSKDGNIVVPNESDG